jgi:hypothetical protein
VVKGLVLFAFPKFVSCRGESFSLNRKLVIILSTLQVRVQHLTPIALYYVLTKYSEYLIIKDVILVLLCTSSFLFIKMNFTLCHNLPLIHGTWI